MGQYLYVGICYNVKVSKERIIRNEIEPQKVFESVEKELGKGLYERFEREDHYEWKLKEKILVEQLEGFLKEQYKLISVKEEESSKIFDKLKKMNSFQQIIELAERKEFENFQAYRMDKRINCGGWNKEIYIQYSCIVFFLAGKIYLEGYNKFVKYIERLVKNNSSYKLVEGVKVIIE